MLSCDGGGSGEGREKECCVCSPSANSDKRKKSMNKRLKDNRIKDLREAKIRDWRNRDADEQWFWWRWLSNNSMGWTRINLHMAEPRSRRRLGNGHWAYCRQFNSEIEIDIQSSIV